MKIGNATIEVVDGEIVVTGDDLLAEFVEIKMLRYSETEAGDPAKRVLADLEVIARESIDTSTTTD